MRENRPYGSEGGVANGDPYPYHDGYRFETGRRHVRKKSLNKLKDTIREKTRRCGGVSLEAVIASLNPMLRGWFGYFKQAHPTTFADIDGFIRRRLRSMLLKQKTAYEIS